MYVTFTNLSLLVCMFLTFEQCFSLTCIKECQCRLYPRRPVICNFGPVNSSSSFPSGAPPETFSLSFFGYFVAHNRLAKITRQNLVTLSNLKYLNLKFCELSSIEDGALSGLSGLLELHLQHCKMQTVTAKTFEGLSKLNILGLSGNPDCMIDAAAFVPLSSLKELYLGDMALKEIQGMLSSVTGLKKLDLHGNEIKTIGTNFLSQLSNLEYLDLTGNMIMSLSNSAGSLIRRITTVHMIDNPWHCNCELRWLKSLPSKYTYDKDTGRSIICASPDKVKYMSIMNIPDNDFICKPPHLVNCTQPSYTVNYQSPLNVQCLIKGDPFPTVVWKRPTGESFVSGNVSGSFNILDNGTLEIEKVSQTDNGTWTLILSNVQGHDKRQVPITVIMPTTTTTTTLATTTTTTTTTTSSTSTTTYTPVTTKHHTNLNFNTKSNSKSGQAGSLIKTLRNSVSSASTQSTLMTSPSTNSSKVQESNASGNNLILIAGAAGGGAALLGLCCLLVYCIKRKKNKNKVQDIRPKKKFDSVKTPRQTKKTPSNDRRQTKKNNKTIPSNDRKKSTIPKNRTLSYLDF